MSWTEASLLLFGGLIALMGFGLPVAFAFLALNVLGAWLFLGGEPGLSQLARNAVQSITSFSLTPIPFFVLMGEVLFHAGVALKAIDAFAVLIRRVPGRLAVISMPSSLRRRTTSPEMRLAAVLAAPDPALLRSFAVSSK